jgi:hypothetical protein
VCLGAALARLETRIALEHLHEAMADYAFDERTSSASAPATCAASAGCR